MEIARFRLLASIVSNQGNDKASLGVHDANLLFAEGGDFTFGRPELIGLLSCGLEHFSHENAPLWRWAAAIGGFTREILPIYSVIGSSTERKVGALAAMRLISEPLSSDSPYNREFYLDCWFAKDEEDAVKIAALNYLGDCGLTTDIPTINQELGRDKYQTTSAAADAIIRINLRDSREKSILSLYELQPTSISRKILAALFDNDVVLSTETLLNGVAHRNSEVRRIVVELLCNRRALPIESAYLLLTDSDAKIRYEALKCLVNDGHTFSDTEAKKTLIRQVQNNGHGLLSVGTSDSEGENCWSHFQLQHLRSLEDKALEAIEFADLIFDQDPHFILAERQFKRRGEALRRSVDDQFKEAFSQALLKKNEQFGEHADLLDNIRSLEDLLRKELTRKGLDVICRKAESCDLGRVRRALKSGFISYSDFDVEYLRRFGEWEDIPLIIASVSRPESGHTVLAASLLSASDAPKYRAAARAIYALGRTRLSEVLAMAAPSRLLSQLIVESSDNAFRTLSDVSINLLLQSEDDAVRKSAALKCVRALPKRHIAKLLADYVSGVQSRYYNVVYWLDFGVSTPKDRALLAIDKVFDKDLRDQ